MLTEVQTSVPTMWQIGPQLDFTLAAFPSFLLYPNLFLPVLEKIPPPLSSFHKFIFLLFVFLKCTYKKKKKKEEED
jgi:hypothetical protein